MSKPKTMMIDEVKYEREDTINEKAVKFDGMDYVIVRTYSAGVFAGYLKERNGKECVLVRSRRLWYWKGAASISQIAEEGVKNGNECKFPCELTNEHTITEGIEFLICTQAAKKSISEVPIWKK